MEMNSAWAMFLLLTGSQVLVTHSWRIRDGGIGIENYFLATVEYALHIFNVKSKDTNAYRLVNILDSKREKKVGGCTFLPCWPSLVESQGERQGLSNGSCTPFEVYKICQLLIFRFYKSFYMEILKIKSMFTHMQYFSISMSLFNEK